MQMMRARAPMPHREFRLHSVGGAGPIMEASQLMMQSGDFMMSKSRTRPDDLPVAKPPSKKRRIQFALRQQWMDREMQFFPQPDPPQYKPLG